MRFQHSPAIWADHPSLAAGIVHATGITAGVDVHERTALLLARARARLDEQAISEMPEIQAWRRAFAAMGLKPTQYRCAAESLLRRVQKEGALPSIHPLVDLCNHVSIAHAIPIAAIDLANVHGDLTVRPADGTEHYLAFSGETEQPAPGEVVFADDAGAAHARRWTHRQSAASAIRPSTSGVLVVVEALHETAASDVHAVLDALRDAIRATWGTVPTTATLSEHQPAWQRPVA